MNKEIERKFLVRSDHWQALAGEGLFCEQGYLASSADGVTVRVRRMGGRGFLTIKGPTEGISRTEMEYEIPEADAEAMIKNLCGGRMISKTRALINFGGFIWEIDVFAGANEGLVLAEIELESEDQSFETPDWLGEEVSHDARYFNSSLAKNPYRNWVYN
jgi:adenylate cyclase